MKKIYSSLMTATLSLFSLASLGQEVFEPYYEILEDVPVPLYAVSANGKYATGEFEGTVAVYDVDNKTVSSFYDPQNSGTMLKCVSDNGIAGGEFGIDLNGAASLYKEGEWAILPVPQGYVKEGGVVNGMSRDASILVGYVSDGVSYQPCIWTRQDDTYLPEILPAPDKDIWGSKPYYTMCNGMNEDGSVLYGRLNDFTGFYYFPVIWQKKGDEYVYEIIGEELLINEGAENPGPQPQFEDYVTADPGTPEYIKQCEDFDMIIIREWWQKVEAYISPEIISVSNGTMSANGRYLVFNVGKQPYKVDIQNECKITPFEVEDALACGVADDGTTVLGTPAGFSARTALIASGEDLEPVVMVEWLKEKYGLEIPGGEMYSDIGTPAISADGKTIVSYFMINQVVGASMVIRVADTHGIYSLEKMGREMTFKDNQLYLPSAHGQIKITDLAGKKVFAPAVLSPITGLSFLPGGFYVVEVDMEGETLVRKILVRK